MTHRGRELPAGGSTRPPSVWKAARILPALLLLAGAAGGLLPGCDRAPSDPLLAGTGERLTPAVASISGRVLVSGQGAPLPAVRVYALRNIDTTCVSQFREIQVLGNYTDPEFSVGNTPVMQQLAGCVWVDSIYLDPAAFVRTPGLLQWKFVTSRSFDNPADYGSPGSQVDGLEGAIVSGANGDDGNLLANVSAAGRYLALLDEEGLRYSILPWDEAPLADIDRQTGEFTVDHLRDGTYTLVFRGAGLVTRRVTRIVVSAGAGVSIGDVTLRSATVAITGRVGYADNPATPPAALVNLLPASGDVPLQAATTSGAFSFSGLEPAAYRLQIRASGYRDTTQAVTYAGQVVDVGTIVLQPGCSSVFTKIQVAGDFNSFSLTTAPNMTNVSGCVWRATVNGIPAGDQKFKFVTNGAFDNPQDYGSDEVCRAGLTGAVQLVQGTGTAICVTFAEAGNYRFTLDEEALTYAIEKIVIEQPGSIRGTVTFAGTPAPGLKAFVQVFEEGTTTLVDSDSTSGAFEFGGLAAGGYDVGFSATGYESLTRSATVAAGQTVDLGTVQLQVGFTSRFQKIEVIGDFPGVNWDPGAAPDMTQSPPGVWKAVVTGVTGGNHLFKFRTNDNWETPDGDYGSPTDETCRANLTGPVKLLTAYPAPALCVTFPAGTADYEFTLDEKNLTYAIARQGQAGTGSISGTVVFTDVGQPPFPPATAHLQTQAGATDIGTAEVSTVTGRFSFTQLEAGTYKVLVTAGCYQTATVANLVVGTGAVDAGTINLARSTSRFTVIQLVGSFNGFSESAPPMTQVTACVWADTVDITDVAAPTQFKFRTNNNWDDEPDYGAPAGQEGLLSGPVALGAPGEGGNIRVQLAETGTYRFELDESFLTYEITRLGPVGSGRRHGTGR